MDFLYIDESGNIHPNGTKYLIIAGILIKNNHRAFNNIVNQMRKNKFKKELKPMNELKGNKCSSQIIKHLLKEINNTNSTIYVSIFKKGQNFKLNYPKDFNQLYDKVAAEIAKNLIIKDELEIRIDKSKSKQKIKEFNEEFCKNIPPTSYPIHIYHSQSHAWKGLQVADIVSWSYFQKYEHKNPEYVNLLKLEKIEKII